MSRAPRKLLVAGVFAAALLVPGAAQAGERENEANALYTKAGELTKQGKCQDAIPFLERSYALVPSPNSLLLLGRCLREGGRIEEAWRRLEASLGKSEELIAAGELRYSATATSARDELTQLRKITGSLVVKDVAPGAHVEVYGMRIDPMNGVARARVRTGETRIAIVDPATRGANERRVVEIRAEQTTEISIARPSVLEPPKPTPNPEQPPKNTAPPPPRWVMPAAVTSGVVGAIGLGAFGFFGLRSSSVRDDLDRCSPSCPDSLRDDATRASREQTYANVGLGVGIVGLVAMATFLVIQASH